MATCARGLCWHLVAFLQPAQCAFRQWLAPSLTATGMAGPSLPKLSPVPPHGALALGPLKSMGLGTTLWTVEELAPMSTDANSQAPSCPRAHALGR